MTYKIISIFILFLAPSSFSKEKQYDIVGKNVGLGGGKTFFWEKYEGLISNKDSIEFDKYKRSNNKYERCLAIYLTPLFSDSSFLLESIKSVEQVQYGSGCFVFDKYIGQIAYSIIRGSGEDVRYPFPNSRRIDLSLKILSDSKLIYLHEDAGRELSNMIGIQNEPVNISKAILPIAKNGFVNAHAMGVILTSIQPKLEEEKFKINMDSIRKLSPERFAKFHDSRDSTKLHYLLILIQNNDILDETKKYIVEYLYSNFNSIEVGNNISSRIERSNASPEIKNYSELLYKEYVSSKPIFNTLNSIHTWKEMDKNKDKIGMALKIESPLIFKDAFSLSPSTLQESVNLRKQKSKYLISYILKYGKKSDSYFSYMANNAITELNQRIHSSSYFGLKIPPLPDYMFNTQQKKILDSTILTKLP